MRNLVLHFLKLVVAVCMLCHGAFQTGYKAVGWNMNSVLRRFYKLFHDSPARRADYIEITNSNIFSKKFCSKRWVENASVAQRT